MTLYKYTYYRDFFFYNFVLNDPIYILIMGTFIFMTFFFMIFFFNDLYILIIETL